ncbi:hypothetical protein K7X08_004128 [Anisodus acutangulus]|uniref:RanBD1 domain-containing protein n=1 Tax=Anisodus acutangulus TaxID=402998 RepID=A0A9Q1RK12_9SOLA|nr:hypothetical protein K7X08_004128 [Anisodus acutangulus]
MKFESSSTFWQLLNCLSLFCDGGRRISSTIKEKESRDNPGLDDDNESSEQESGTFERASDEVMASRRIVKVSKTASTTTTPSNPFASIQLVPPADTSTTPVVITTEVGNGTKTSKEPEEPNDQKRKSDESKADVSADKEKVDNPNGPNKPQSTEKKAAEKGSPLGFGSESGAGSGSLFGLKSDQSSFGLPTNINASGSSSVKKGEGTGFPSMQEVPVETGEENEKAIFTADSVLFEYLNGGWKERGKGELKINISSTGTGKARLVMRTRGNYRLILNANLYPEMKLTSMDKKGVTFVCVNSAGDGKYGLSTIALKFKDPSTVEEFRAAVIEHKDKMAVPLKTPQNSP